MSKVKPTVLDRLVKDLPPGKVEWIGLRPARREPMINVEQTMALAELGLEGDRRSKGRPGVPRQVTLISQEHIAIAANLLKREHIPPELLRRNIVVSGVNINALRYKTFRIGDALFEAGAYCHPCSRMEENLGTHGFAAMLGHGGLCAKILESGQIRIGDKLVLSAT